jgi:hypothetical protein
LGRHGRLHLRCLHLRQCSDLLHLRCTSPQLLILGRSRPVLRRQLRELRRLQLHLVRQRLHLWLYLCECISLCLLLNKRLVRLDLSLGFRLQVPLQLRLRQVGHRGRLG